MKKKYFAIQLWADANEFGKREEIGFSRKPIFHDDIPVAVIPLDDVDALVAKAYGAYCDEIERFESNDEYRDIQAAMRSALTAIGVLPKKRKGRK